MFIKIKLFRTMSKILDKNYLENLGKLGLSSKKVSIPLPYGTRY